MSTKFKLAIIIPIYEVEDYIVKLTNSLLPQLTEDIQLIFINDGTKDKSILYLEQELAQVPISLKHNIQIIHQENQGLSAARNKGLMYVKDAAYTTFLDSDDYVLEHYITNILKAIVQYDFDIMHFNFLQETPNQQKIVIHYVEKTQLTINSQEPLEQIFQKNHWFAWARVIKTELLDQFKFPVGLIYEDILSIPLLYRENLKIYDLSQPLIVYQYRPTSITNNSKKEKVLESFKYGIELYRDKSHMTSYRYVYFHILEMVFNIYLYSNLKEYLNFINQHQHTDLSIMKKYIKEFHWKKRLMILFPKAFYFYKNRTKLFKKQ